MDSVRNTEEMSKMKVRLLALAFGFSLVAGTAYAGPTPGGADTDSDGVENAFDNCLTVSNSAQADTDHNGCGDSCTLCASAPCSTAAALVATRCDFNHVGGGPPAAGVHYNDYRVGAPDVMYVQGAVGMVPSAAGQDGDCASLGGGGPDGMVGSPDVMAVQANVGSSLGPSGITTATCDPATCGCTPQ